MTEPEAKRRRLAANDAEDIRNKRSTFLSSLSRSISPPLKAKNSVASVDKDEADSTSLPAQGQFYENSGANKTKRPRISTSFNGDNTRQKMLPSPFKLARISGLPDKANNDTISLHDILGDPLIKQAWIFDFCFDVNWTMQHFDADVRELVDVKIVHGSWKKEDGNRLAIKDHLQRWKNVQDIAAYLPDPFGTHHSKMIILFKHDDTAQIYIHTANMLEKDWDHMTQAVWQSPILPLQDSNVPEENELKPLGSGGRFKHDLLRYIKAYGGKLKPLTGQLTKYDFSSVRAALIASVPSYQKVSEAQDQAWGHLALKNAISTIYQRKVTTKSCPRRPYLICQISSIATLPSTWINETIFEAARAGQQPVSSNLTTSIIYPTPTDLRESLIGYATGGSIHTKIASTAQQKQVATLRPQLHRWGGQSTNAAMHAGRHMIPPHIKTYICFNDKPEANNPAPGIQWALLTSANLSTQAWGTAPKIPKGVKDPGQAVVHISSFEIGVLVWPELFLEQEENGVGSEKERVRMVPVFGKDLPDAVQEDGKEGDGGREIVVGLRMPYDLPLTPYGNDEMPWSPSASYNEPDRLGQMW